MANHLLVRVKHPIDDTVKPDPQIFPESRHY